MQTLIFLLNLVFNNFVSTNSIYRTAYCRER